MSNLLAQVLTLLSGLLINFFVPAIYGLEAYGEFIQQNILAFFIHKLTDSFGEPLISHAKAESVLVASISLNIVVILIFVLACLFQPIGSPLLLASMLLSSSVILSIYALRRVSLLIGYYVLMLTLFFVLIIARTIFSSPVSILDLMFYCNAIPTLISIAVLLRTSARPQSYKEIGHLLLWTLRLVPRFASVTLVYNTFSNLLPALLSRTLSHHDLGLYRVITAIIQSATSIFPINTRVILSSFLQNPYADKHYATLIATSAMYFNFIGLLALGTCFWYPPFRPYAVLVCVLPVLYWAVITERFLLAIQLSSLVSRVNILLAAIISLAALFTQSINDAILLYAIGFSTYASILIVFTPAKLNRWAVAWVLFISPIAVYVQNFNLGAAVLMLIISFTICFFSFKIRGADLRAMLVSL